MKKWASFAVKSPTEITHEASHPMGGDRQSGHQTSLPEHHSLTQLPVP